MNTGVLCGQSGTEFWLAPPDITDLHNTPGGEPLYLLLSSMGESSVVTIEQPANPSFVPISVSVPANKSKRVNLTPYKSLLETRPVNTVLNTGLHVTSTQSITCYYECANTNNTDIWALKGPNAEGTEFYIPLHKHAPFYNEASFGNPHKAIASFDICATQDGTIVTIYSPTPVDGHAALQQFAVTLNRGQTYSCGFTGTNWSQPSTHPSGAIVLASKPVTVSLKDDSNHNPSGGCYDILGDQIVPVDVVGEDYIAVKGSLNNTGDESVVIMATQNNTQVFVNGGSAPVATLFAGEYYRIDMDNIAAGPDNAVYIHCSRPSYAMHITGFGCEMGMAQLPPLNCAGSRQLNFVRDDAQTFYITILCRAAAINGFTVSGPGTATILPASFQTVPGTSGEWMAARINYDLTQVPVDSTFHVSNSVDVFALGVVNGGATSGCKYGYFSEFVAPIEVNAGLNQTVCAKTTASLQGSVAGGTTTGEWKSSGTGTFSPSNTALNAIYTPSAADAALGSVTLTLTSTGACVPVSDDMVLTITPAPVANAGADLQRCSNNALVSLEGSVTVATGGVWTGGGGSFVPANNVLNPAYIPTTAEIAAGSLILTLTSTGNGICQPTSDNILVSFTPAPVVNAGADRVRCGNNASVTLTGSVTVATGVLWTGGGGSFNPSATSLSPVYTPSADEISAGSVTLTLTSTGNGSCNAVSDQMTIFFTSSPTASAGSDQEKCANNPSAVLDGSVTVASGGIWSGGLGVFSPGNTALHATYTPTASEIASGSVTLTLTTTGNATCNSSSDQVRISFTASPTVNAGANTESCANNSQVALNASYTISSGIAWSGGAGTFIPSNTAPGAVYHPTQSEISAGSVALSITTTGNGTCLAVTDETVVTIKPSPVVNAGSPILSCENNPIATLNGVVANSGGGIWSGGQGFFTPDNTALNAVYHASQSEIETGNVVLTLTSSGNGQCSAVSDDVTVSFAPAPVADAGMDISVCANNAIAGLNGLVNFSGGGQWSGGLGLFTPSPNAPNASYTPTVSDIALGYVDLVLSTTSNGSCLAERDTVRISYNPAPTVNAGSAVLSCANNPEVILNGQFTISESAQWSGGSGTFSPHDQAMNAVYTPSQVEIEAGTSTLVLTSIGVGNCLSVQDEVTITITPAPVVHAGTDRLICISDLNVSLSGSVSGPTHTGRWESTGSGSFSPDAFALNAVYQCSPQDAQAGSVRLTLTSTANGACTEVSDDMIITILPSGVAQAGEDKTVCGNNASVSLQGSVGGGATDGVWGTTGSGIFLPSAQSLNATYIPGPLDIASGGVTVFLTANSCQPQSDSVRVVITPAPMVYAGADKVICSTQESTDISGTVSGGSTTGVWSVIGTGVFSGPLTALSNTFIPGEEDILGQSVKLSLISTNNGNCVAVSDTIEVRILPAAVVNAGGDQTVCNSGSGVELSGVIGGGAVLGHWVSSGTGTFENASSPSEARYIPDASDIQSGSVNLALIADNSCNNASDFMTITFSDTPEVDAGTPLFSCANNSQVILNGNFSVVEKAMWSGGQGTFFPDNETMNAIYTPTSTEVTEGVVVLKLTSESTAHCDAVQDSVRLEIRTAPIVHAGTDKTVCADYLETMVQGSISGGASQGVWTTSGSGLFLTNPEALTTVYRMSAQDSLAGQVMLRLTTTDHGLCESVFDEMIIRVAPEGTATAGDDIQVCESAAEVQLSGVIGGNANSSVWVTNGDGTFSPSANQPDARYAPGVQDKLSGEVRLILHAISCNNAADTLDVRIDAMPVADAGPDSEICISTEEIELYGGGNAAVTGGLWSSDGSGEFITPVDSEQATYAFGEQDYQEGSVGFIWTVESSGTCPSSSDERVITFYSSGTVNAGADQLVCESTEEINLNAQMGGGVTQGVWTVVGNGSFLSSANEPSTRYAPVTSDVQMGSIIFVFTGSGGCGSATDSVNVEFSESVMVALSGPTAVCENVGGIELTATLNGSGEIIWTGGSGTFTPGDSEGQNTYSPSQAEINTGEIMIVVRSSGNNVCPEASDTLTVSIESLPELSAGADRNICSSSSSVELTGSIASGVAHWSTSGSGYFVSPVENATNEYVWSAEDSIAGEVFLILSSQAGVWCPAHSDSLTLRISVPASVNAGSDRAVCTIDFPVEIVGLISPAGSSATWSHTGSGNMMTEPANDTLIYAPSSSDITNGRVDFMLTSLTNGACPSVTDTASVFLSKPAIANAGADQIVCGAQTQVLVSGDVSGSAEPGYWMSSGTGTFEPAVQDELFVYTMSGGDIANGVVSLVLNAAGDGVCPDASDTLLVRIGEMPLAAFMSRQDNEMTVTFSDESIDAASWFWDFGIGGTSTQQNPVFEYPSDGSYEVTLVVHSADGCADTVMSRIEVLAPWGTPVAIPTGFSPNGDGSNDELHVLGGPFRDVDFRVYNQWGNLVFSTTNPDEGWDGTYKGVKQPGGVYVYTAVGNTMKGRFVKLSGNVTLIR